MKKEKSALEKYHDVHVTALFVTLEILYTSEGAHCYDSLLFLNFVFQNKD